MKLRTAPMVGGYPAGFALALSLVAAVATAPAHAEQEPGADARSEKAPAGSKAKPKKAGQARAAAGELAKRVALSPRGLRWGMSLEAVAKLYDRQFDAEFVPLYKKAQPGPRLQELDAELAENKALIRRNRVEFGRLPTGFDQGPLKGEYSYGNGESISHLTLSSGTKRYFFFFNDRLWKVYDEHRLKEGGTLGATYASALEVLTKRFGSAPKRIEQDFEKGRPHEEAHWQDNAMLIRAVNREPVLGMVYADRSVQDKLATLRKNKPSDPHQMDRDVAAATDKPKPETPPAPEARKDKADGKGKAKGKGQND